MTTLLKTMGDSSPAPWQNHALHHPVKMVKPLEEHPHSSCSDLTLDVRING